MRDVLVRTLGLRGMLLHSDPLVTDRALWLRDVLTGSFVGRPIRKALDAGCGNGVFTILTARRSPADVLGLSDSPHELASATRRARLLGAHNAHFEVQDLRSLEGRDDLVGYDLVLCFEVIEHVLDDQRLVDGLAARLLPGGLLLLTTPTDDHSPLYGEREHLSGVEDGRHVRWGYSRTRLTELVQGAGLEMLDVAPLSGVLSRFTCSVMWRIQQRSMPVAWFVTLPLRLLRLVDPAVSRRAGRPSHCWGVVARKPLRS